MTTLMGVAAAVLIWRTWAGPSAAPAPQRSSAPVFEDLASSKLTTSIADAPALGESNASVVLIEYSDFECPFCARHASETFKSIETEFIANGRITYVFRNYPIEQIHPSAMKAVQAAGCAHRQGRFLEMRTLLFANYRTLAGMDWGKAAIDLELDEAQFDACLGGSEVGQIRAEKQEADRLGVTSTPTFFIATRASDGRVRIVSRTAGAAPYALFKDRLERTLATIDPATLARKE